MSSMDTMTDAHYRDDRLSEKQLHLVYQRILRSYDDKCSFTALLNCLSRLHLCRDTETLRHVFESCDQKKKGHLSFDEFSIAYDILFARSKIPSPNILQNSVVYVKAIRYGYSKVDKKYIYEVISGTSYELMERVIYSTDLKGVGLGSAGVEVVKMTGNFESLVGLVLTDQATNSTNGSELRWWIRLSSDTASNEPTTRCAVALGLPYLFPPSDGDSARVFTPSSHRQHVLQEGIRRIYTVQSLSIALRASYLTRVPVVEINASSRWSLRRYYVSRISVFRSHANLPCSEHANALRRADGIGKVSFPHAQVNLDEGEQTSEVDGLFGRLDGFEDDDATTATDSLLGHPSSQVVRRGASDPGMCGKFEDVERMLLGTSDLRRSPPMIESQTVACHLLKLGEGTNCLVTFNVHHSSDEITRDEGPPRLFYHARCKEKGSVLYRLLNGVAKHLLHAIQNEGVSTNAALAASSIGLLETIAGAVIGFNVESLNAFAAWSHALSNLPIIVVKLRCIKINYRNGYHGCCCIKASFPHTVAAKLS